MQHKYVICIHINTLSIHIKENINIFFLCYNRGLYQHLQISIIKYSDTKKNDKSMDKRQQGEVFLFNKKTSYFYLINFIFYLIKKLLLAAFYQLTYQHDSKDFNICNYKQRKMHQKYVLCTHINTLSIHFKENINIFFLCYNRSNSFCYLHHINTKEISFI